MFKYPCEFSDFHRVLCGKINHKVHNGFLKGHEECLSKLFPINLFTTTIGCQHFCF